MSALYLCYLGIDEPLVQTQVVAYLEGLLHGGFRPVLLTFEPRPLTREETDARRARLAARGVRWHWVRYHKRPTVPATAWDVLVGIVVGLALVRSYRVKLLHARSHVPGVMALVLKWLTGARLLFDVRGFMAEEYVDAGVWPAGGFLFRLTKRLERRLVRAADGIVVLTARAKELLQRWYPRECRGKPVRVIPCCVDLRDGRFPDAARAPGGDGLALVYVGKLGGWYLVEEMAALAAAARDAVPNFRWQVWTQSAPDLLRPALRARGLNGEVAVGTLPPEEVGRALTAADVAVSLIKPCLSKLSSSPTKVAEYLAAGLPVISTAGIGDLDDVLGGRGRGPVGVLVRELDERGYRQALAEVQELRRDPELAARCRRVAREEFDLRDVGWARYVEMYRAVAGV